MTTTANGLNAFPPESFAVTAGGQITPESEQLFDRIAGELAAVCNRYYDLQAAFRLLLEIIPKTFAEATLDTLVTKHGLQIEEWDTATLDEELRDKLMAFYVETRSKKTIVVPRSQDPGERFHPVCRLLTHLGVTV